MSEYPNTHYMISRLNKLALFHLQSWVLHFHIHVTVTSTHTSILIWPCPNLSSAWTMIWSQSHAFTALWHAIGCAISSCPASDEGLIVEYALGRCLVGDAMRSSFRLFFHRHLRCPCGLFHPAGQPARNMISVQIWLLHQFCSVLTLTSVTQMW